MQNKAKVPQAVDTAERAADAAKVSTGFPRAVVKRIVMLDADQARIAADALDLTGKAAELFLETLAEKAGHQAAGAGRSTVNLRDVGANPASASVRSEVS